MLSKWPMKNLYVSKQSFACLQLFPHILGVCAGVCVKASPSQKMKAETNVCLDKTKTDV